MKTIRNGTGDVTVAKFYEPYTYHLLFSLRLAITFTIQNISAFLPCYPTIHLEMHYIRLQPPLLKSLLDLGIQHHLQES